MNICTVTTRWPCKSLPPHNGSWEKMTHEHPLQQLSWHRQKRRKLRTLQKCTFTTTFTYNFQGAPEAMKRRNAGSKSLLKFRSHQEEQSQRAFSWAGYPMKAKGPLPFASENGEAQEVQWSIRRQRDPKKKPPPNYFMVFRKKLRAIKTNQPQAIRTSFLKCQWSF